MAAIRFNQNTMTFVQNLKKSARTYLGQSPKRYNVHVLNILGIQVLRILIERFFYHLRSMLSLKRYVASKNVVSIAKKIEDEGLVVIENFLPADAFAKLKAEYDYCFLHLDEFNVHRRRTGNLVLEDIRIYSEAPSRLQNSLLYVKNDKTIRDAIELASARKIRLEPTCVLQRALQSDKINSKQEIHGNVDFDTETVFHVDHSFPVYKAWLYIEDVTEQNGAFEYEKNTQKVTLEKLKYEYKRSIYLHHAENNKMSLIPSEYIDRERITMSEGNKKKIGAEKFVGVGKANTLIIANTCGQHRRGFFENGQVRKLIHLDFRKLDSVLNKVPMIHKLVNIDKFSSQYQ